jgi:hypothetical protein
LVATVNAFVTVGSSGDVDGRLGVRKAQPGLVASVTAFVTVGR